MTFKGKQLLYLTLFALASVIIYQGYYSENVSTEYEPFTKGYALTDVVLKSTDDSGQIVTSMKAPVMTHYLDNDQTVIEQPLVHLYTVDNTWLLQAPTAVYQRNDQQLFFPEQVSVVSQKEPIVDIESSQLTVDLASKQGSTPAAISMKQPTALMQGIGARILFNTKQIEILNNVYAEFEPR